MRPHIIQFANLDDFIPELPVGHTVRVTALDVTEGTYEKSFRAAYRRHRRTRASY